MQARAPYTVAAFDANDDALPDAPCWDAERDLFANNPLVFVTRADQSRRDERTALDDIDRARLLRAQVGRGQVRLVPQGVAVVVVTGPKNYRRRYEIRLLAPYQDVTLRGSGEWEGQPFALRVHTRNPWRSGVRLLALLEEVPRTFGSGGERENPDLAAAVQREFGRHHCLVIGAHLQFAEAVRVPVPQNDLAVWVKGAPAATQRSVRPSPAVKARRR